MKDAADIALQAISNGFSPPAQISQERVEKSTHAMITRAMPVFALYFADFQSKYGKVDEDTRNAVMREYAMQLIKNDVTLKGFELGLERLKKQSTSLKFTPNPQAFAELCKPQPEDIGLPNPTDALREVIQARGPHKGQGHDYSHRAIEILDMRVGHLMYEKDAAKFEKAVRCEYESIVTQAMNDGLPEPRVAIEHSKPQPEAPIDRYIRLNGKPTATKDPLIDRLNSLKGKP